jgi:hypothetical protein
MFRPMKNGIKAVSCLGLLGALLTSGTAMMPAPHTREVFGYVSGTAHATNTQTNPNPTHTSFFAQGPVSGFDKEPNVQMLVDTLETDPFTGQHHVEGFVSLVRSSGGSGRRGKGNGHKIDSLFFSYSGFAISTDYGVAYLGTADVVSGSGQLEGATGNMAVSAFQQGYLPAILPGPGVPVDIQLEGEYTVN